MADGILTPCNVAQSWHWFRQVTAPCNVIRGSWIMTVNSPSGSTLQCDTWLWDDMPLSSPKCPPYWSSTSGFNFDRITAVDMSFCTSLQNFYQNIASLPSWTLGVALNCLVFEKIAFWWHTDKQTDRRTNGQARRIKPLSLLRAAA